MEIMGTANYS